MNTKSFEALENFTIVFFTRCSNLDWVASAGSVRRERAGSLIVAEWSLVRMAALAPSREKVAKLSNFAVTFDDDPPRDCVFGDKIKIFVSRRQFTRHWHADRPLRESYFCDSVLFYLVCLFCNQCLVLFLYKYIS